ncbi:MAG: site-2 protease family protein [Chloroflexi bacterium]|nr:site-2 protease family protein [Chloroflexota bacterium]
MLWLLVIPVLGFLIFVHELGHFLTAKRFGIKVEEFGFGFPPRIWGFRYGETLYSINWIPLGGFVKMLGEEDPTHPRSFARQSVLKRAIVLSAGSFMNLLTPIVIFSILFMIPQNVTVGDILITGIAPGSPAQQAGLRAGDTIVRVDGAPLDNHVELQQHIFTKLGSAVELDVRRGAIVSGLGSSPEFSAIETVRVVPRLNPPELVVVETVTDPSKEVSLRDARRYDPELNIGDVMTQGAIGVTIGTANARLVKKSHPIWEAVPMSFGELRDVLVITKNGFARWIAGGPDPGLTGPVGIARVTGEVAEAGISPLFQFMAIISISLGIVNILPIPALDGGRLLFVIIEWVRRGKRISPQREGLVHLVGFVVLISLIVFISYFDIVRLLNGESVIR